MRKRNLTLIIPVVLTLCLLVAARGARAEEALTVEKASAQEIVDGMANKLARGVTNTATGWLELPKQIYLTSKEDGVARGATVGLVKGLGMTVARTFSGAGEAVTFMISYPGFFAPFIEPAYVWQKE